MLSSLDFGDKWCSWIKGCPFLAKTSVLVNGSPSREFTLKRGLRQGDPLSPYLFITVMEGIHLAFDRAMDIGFIRRIKIDLATVAGARMGTFPTTYLGIPIGSNMNKIANWDSLCDKLRSKLST
ncbi:uncharacterized protein [Rutidosis leptorrhynchoides]|uniref:uncharacterized protein n=1 Tax=Rutidosis leptorrhynchoides TaxID=125765 RepID=UPI003A9A2D9B